MGDDLYIARVFSNAALADISAIDAMENSRNPADMTHVTALLASIQSGAKRLRARAIYQSTQIVIDGLNPNLTSEDNFKTRLSALTQLVHQYTDGLNEIDTPKNTAQNQHTPELGLETDALSPAQNDMDETRSLETHIQSAENLYNSARATLSQLMPLVRGTEQAALQSLMDYDPEKAPKPVKDLKTDPQIPLEYVLRDAIQDALSIARISAKTISISYDVGQGHIESVAVKPLEKRLCEGLRALIMQSLPQDGIGHIDINLRGKNMVVSSPHEPPRLLPQHIICRKTQTGCELTLPLTIKPDEILPANHDTPAQPLSAEPNAVSQPINSQAEVAANMITPETEAQLRSQLNALMESPSPINADSSSQDLHIDDNIIVMSVQAEKNLRGADLNNQDIEAGR